MLVSVRYRLPASSVTAVPAGTVIRPGVPVAPRELQLRDGSARRRGGATPTSATTLSSELPVGGLEKRRVVDLLQVQVDQRQLARDRLERACATTEPTLRSVSGTGSVCTG